MAVAGGMDVGTAEDEGGASWALLASSAGAVSVSAAV